MAVGLDCEDLDERRELHLTPGVGQGPGSCVETKTGIYAIG